MGGGQRVQSLVGWRAGPQACGALDVRRGERVHRFKPDLDELAGGVAQHGDDKLDCRPRRPCALVRRDERLRVGGPDEFRCGGDVRALHGDGGDLARCGIHAGISNGGVGRNAHLDQPLAGMGPALLEKPEFDVRICRQQQRGGQRGVGDELEPGERGPVGGRGAVARRDADAAVRGGSASRRDCAGVPCLSAAGTVDWRGPRQRIGCLLARQDRRRAPLPIGAGHECLG